MTDVLIYQTNDGGEIDFVNGEPKMSAGLQQASYLSMFGGNAEDSGSEADKAKQWWGNFDEPDPARRYRSETQFVLKSMAAIPANLRLLQDAVIRDHNWMTIALAATISALATIPALGRVAIKVNIEIGATEYTFVFLQTWGAQT